MPAPTITTLPPAPSRGDAPDLFVSRADAFVAALAELVADANAMGLFMDGVSEASAANLAAQIALVASGGFSGTSTSSNTIATGAKTFVIQANRSFVPGSSVTVAATASPANNLMTGVVTAYNPTTGAITVEVLDTRGSGTYTAWTISLTGLRGVTGPSGIPTPLRKVANYTASPLDRLECDTTTGAFTVTLPPTPTLGDRVTVWDGGATPTSQGFAANNLTIARNGSTIHGLAEDLIVKRKGAAFTIEYINATWRVHLG